MKRIGPPGRRQPPRGGGCRFVIGVSGASGAAIGLRLMSELASRGHEVHAVITDAAVEVIRHEVGASWRLPKAVVRHGIQDPRSALNSSSFVVDAVVVAPCSMKSLSAIAAGHADNILVRAADTALRMGRTLVVVPRETPLSLSALENMAALKRGGAVILPPCASYYHRPRTVDDMTAFFVGKILDVLGVDNELYRRWGDGR
ncbi:MAG: UbiX family flavin prenyltransferase [Elusimicrobia bacterium]|nr:UbiX family flavin prenyltransferase [Elusimicrobiota bacterium]